jgi:hypothetical protein
MLFKCRCRSLDPVTYLKLGQEIDGPAQRFAEEMNDVDEGYRQDVNQISEWFQKVVEPLEQFPEGISNVPQHGESDDNVWVHCPPTLMVLLRLIKGLRG